MKIQRIRGGIEQSYRLTLNEDEMEVLAILLNESDHVLADDEIEIGFKMLDAIERLLV